MFTPRNVVRSGSLMSCILVFLLTPAGAQEIEKGDVVIALEPVATRLASPVKVVHAGDGSGRLFIVDQIGIIHVVDDGVMLDDPFLDLTDTMVELGTFFDERGLLGLAFHPDYADNGRFFVNYSLPREGDEEESCNDPKGFIVGCHSQVIAEYSVSDDDPNVADPDSEVILLSVDEPEFNHDGGDLAFGPDGYLYASFGDGGGAHDGLAEDPPAHGETGHGQNIETLLGSIIRIDVDAEGDGDLEYGIPEDNPFVDADGRDEIYAYGFRNPYRFSFDRGGDNELIVGDVGQNLIEEIDIVELGGNYGWAIKEGTGCFDPTEPGKFLAECDDEDLIDPIAEYGHDDGLSVLGGHVYRGKVMPELDGYYIFNEFSTAFAEALGRLFYIDMNGDRSEIIELVVTDADIAMNLFMKGMGEDEDGELYVCASTRLGPYGSGGAVFRIVPVQDFVRGDSDNDGDFDVNDALITLRHIFLDGDDPCADAMDVNDDGRLTFIDAIALLHFVYLDGDDPSAPYPDCGRDESADQVIGGDLGCKNPLEDCK